MHMCTPRSRLYHAGAAVHYPKPSAQQSVTQQPASPVSPKSQGDALFAQGENAFRNSNYHAAEDYFALAKENYSAAGDKASFLKARDMVLRSMGAAVEFPYNRSAMEAEMAAAFPGVPAAELSRWLDANMTATLKSDGEVWYFEDTVNNVKFHNLSIMRAENKKAKHTPLYEQAGPPDRHPVEERHRSVRGPGRLRGSHRDLDPPRGAPGKRHAETLAARADRDRLPDERDDYLRRTRPVHEVLDR